MMKIFLDKFNSKIELRESDHVYNVFSKDGKHIKTKNNQISTTSIIGLFQEYSFESPVWGMYVAIAKKYNDFSKTKYLSSAVEVMENSMKKHLDYRKERGTELHLKAENGKIERLENIVQKYNWDVENNLLLREQKFYVVFNELGIDMPGTIDLLILNKKTKEAVIIDYKFSNANKNKYLDKQLNIYASVLKKVGIKVNDLIGLTIKDSEEIIISKIKNKDIDLESVLKTINFFGGV